METNNNYPNDQNSNDKKQHTCPYCQKHFLKIEDLNLHVLTKHTGSYSLRKPTQDTQDDLPAVTTS
jgi:hypothetical protein